MITWGTFSYPECPRGLFSSNKCCAREQQTCVTWHAHNVKSSITNICNKRILEHFMSYRMTDNVSLELNVLLPSESESESESESTTTGLLETLCLPFGTRSIRKTCQDSCHKDARKFCLSKPTSFILKFKTYAHQKCMTGALSYGSFPIRHSIYTRTQDIWNFNAGIHTLSCSLLFV